MKSNARRILAALMALMLAVTGMTFSAFAAEAETTDAYVLRFSGEGAVPYLYGSRYECKHSYNDPEAGENSVWTYWNAPEIFNLVNTTTDSSIAAYCTDADTSTTGDTGYRRINLEDSQYHDSGAAARLRAVILNTFPRKNVDEVAAAANAKMGGVIQNLTMGEVISATQQAIWEITHGEKYTVDDNYTSIRSMSAYDTAEFMYPESLSECVESTNTAVNIETLYNYFLTLEGMAPLNDAVSEYTFENVIYGTVKEEDGTYTVTVTFDVNTQIDEGDTLTLRATCGTNVYTEDLRSGANTVTFTGLKEAKEVKLEINGYEQGGDVYLFDAAGERAVSQSMVGYDDSLLPVHGEVVAAPDRVVNILKTTSVDDGSVPLANIQFDLYLVATMEEIETGKVKLSEKPTAEEAEGYKIKEKLVATLITDAQGFATYNLTENGWPDGVYMIVEQFSTATLGPVDPFFVAVPGTNENGDGFVYTVVVSPKNATESGPDIKKDVTKIENNWDTFDVGQTHTWIIRGSVPAGIADAECYVITDTLDYRLTYQGNIRVKVGLVTDEAGTEAVTLEQGTDYTVTVGTATDEKGNMVDTFSVALTADGMDAAAAAVGTGNAADYEVRVYFDAMINTEAEMGVEIPNQAHLDYTNSAGIDYDSDSDVPEVVTGGTNILKIDSADSAPLSGAAFRIARDAGNAEIAAGASEKLNVNGTEKDVVFVDFHATADMSAEKVSQAVSGEDGKIVIYGLAYGDYYIVETKAPKGYNLLTAPICVQIDENSHTDEAVITVTNTKFTLPKTGGAGTTVFTVTGLGIMAAAAVLVAVQGKKKRA